MMTGSSKEKKRRVGWRFANNRRLVKEKPHAIAQVRRGNSFSRRTDGEGNDHQGEHAGPRLVGGKRGRLASGASLTCTATLLHRQLVGPAVSLPFQPILSIPAIPFPSKRFPEKNLPASNVCAPEMFHFAWSNKTLDLLPRESLPHQAKNRRSQVVVSS
jgi:hypothetical protein